MVRPVLPTLEVNRLPTLYPPTSTSPSLSPSTSIAFLSPSPRQALPSLRTPPPTFTTPLHKPTHLRRSPRAASRHDHMLPAAAASVPNFYEILGLADDVAIPDIKSAYRQMARRYHPDVCPDSQVEESTRRFMAVQEAYETLSDPARRASYDRTISSGAASRWGWTAKQDVHVDWKYNWEDQLFNMQQKSAAKEARAPYSWGARMRKQRQEQEQQQQQQDHEYAGF